ncbi:MULTISPECIES: YggT family protein [Actinomyces]|uniref:Ccb3/yggt n=1 Tax=Actinomyces glycerinitolerans TaxID=1892869 RepID=A0A1M4S2L4_9ACTO|nr:MULTISPECIES: YggT family protein [Actinomyces]RAX19322.1 YggT family protein [Actinomyces sp. Z5]RAX24002.1 YggT family protein [Actinomyces sp. Z3]SHE26474.1 ccb3/yggt [Actinomyces glycerinitolerans]
MTAIVVSIISSLLNLYILILLIRVVLDWIQLFARSWRPTGVVLVLANAVYGLTDPPLRQIRRFVPLVRLGGVGIDLSFLVLWFGIVIVRRLLLLLV